jgi:E1A/CREB-binding protein
MSDNISSGSKLILKLSALLWNRNPTSINTESNVSSTANEIGFDNIDDERNTNKCMGSITDDYLLTNQYVAVLRNIESQIPLNIRGQWRNSNNGLQIIESLSYSQIINHLLSLRCEYIHKLMRSVVVKLINHPRNANLFNAPVDPILLKVPDYFSKIKNPMDLGTVRDNLVKGNYESIQQCANDIKLTFENATTFNGPQHNIHLAAKELLTEFYEDYNNMEEKSKKEIEKNNLHDCEYCIRNSCNLCGEKCLKLEPPTLICHGTCSQRIKRNTMYYISIDGIFVWCLKCYSTLPQRILELPNRPPMYKKDLLTRKADEEIPEPIIQCNKCHQYSHQICALYNPKSDSDGTKSPSPSKKNKFKAESNDYRCPLCILKDISFESPQQNNAVAMSPLSKKRARNIEVISSNEEIFTTPPVWKASSLPKSKLSIFLETFVEERLDEMGHGSVKDTITIRMVSNAEHCIDVPMHITQNFMTSENNKIPPQIGYKQKCILLFQNIDGIDVCLFCLYVHEFDESVPLPNKSCVYIAYLDSIDYFRPLEARTYVYHEIVVGYLKWAQVRGFKRCHIWSCPPQRGDNFIFWCHPSHQKTPSRDRLNAWYNAMLLRATEIGIVGDVTTMWDAYFIQYSKKDKDESNTRLAAKYSLIGSGTMLKRTNSLPSNLEDKSGTTLLTRSLIHLLTYSLTHSFSR